MVLKQVKFLKNWPKNSILQASRAKSSTVASVIALLPIREVSDSITKFTTCTNVKNATKNSSPSGFWPCICGPTILVSRVATTIMHLGGPLSGQRLLRNVFIVNETLTTRGAWGSTFASNTHWSKRRSGRHRLRRPVVGLLCRSRKKQRMRSRCKSWNQTMEF